MQMYHYHTRICLIQLRIDDVTYLLDPLATKLHKGALQPVMSALQDKTLVMHGGDFDLRLLAATYGFAPRQPVFDTMLAAQLLNYDKKSLAALTLGKLGVELDKGAQKSNWSRRPLTEKMLEYAALDVKYLAYLREMLQGELRDAGRLDWHVEQCEALMEKCRNGFHTERGSQKGEAWRVTGYEALRLEDGSVGLHVLRSVFGWRDGHARELDLAPYRLVRNDVLVKMAALSTRHAVRGMPVTDIEEAVDRIVGGRVLSAIGFTKRPALRGELINTLRQAVKAALCEFSSSKNCKLIAARGERKRKVEDSLLCEEEAALAHGLRDARDVIAARVGIDGTLICSRGQLDKVAIMIYAGLTREDALRRVLLNWQANLMCAGERQ